MWRLSWAHINDQSNTETKMIWVLIFQPLCSWSCRCLRRDHQSVLVTIGLATVFYVFFKTTSQFTMFSMFSSRPLVSFSDHWPIHGVLCFLCLVYLMTMVSFSNQRPSHRCFPCLPQDHRSVCCHWCRGWWELVGLETWQCSVEKCLPWRKLSEKHVNIWNI